ncbi:MAG TPA: hypothetical protein PLZ57_03280 [Pseudobdellovibrionaceae bacterium]|nr:hypothetical protein [Pseudobdellovibrionaceae bacterium]
MAKLIEFPIPRQSRASISQANMEGAPKSTTQLLIETPIIRHAMFLLAEAGGDVGIKLTDTGALNRKFVQTFWDQFSLDQDQRFRPMREIDCPEVARIRELLEIKEYVQIANRSLRLTARGIGALKDGPTFQLYRNLFDAGLLVWNWACEDRFPEFEFIQNSGAEMIEKLWHWPNSTLTAVEFSDGLFHLVNEHGEAVHMTYQDGPLLGFDTYEAMVHCLNLRFFVRFCVPFGILVDLGPARWMMSPKDLYQRSEFFISDFPRAFGAAEDQ